MNRDCVIFAEGNPSYWSDEEQTDPAAAKLSMHSMNHIK